MSIAQEQQQGASADAVTPTTWRLVDVDRKTEREVSFPDENFATVDAFAESLRAQHHTVKVLPDGDQFQDFAANYFNLYDVRYLLVRS